MRRLFTYSMFLLILLGLSLLAVPDLVQASPANYGQTRPTANVVTGITVTNPTYAYDGSNTTYADFNYVAASGSFEVKNFRPLLRGPYTAYLTSTTWTENSLTAYAIRGSQTAAYLSRTFTSPTTTAEWGIRVWKRTSAGVETEITATTPVALVVRSATGSGVLSTTWTAPRTSLATTDAIVVRVYCGQTGGPYTLLETFTTRQLTATTIETYIWTVYYWTSFNTTTKVAEYRFGTTTYNSRITNFLFSNLPTTINSVDLKIRYETTISSKDDTYRIVYQVDPSLTVVVLKAWTRDTTALATYVFNLPNDLAHEPNNGVWDWTDLWNLRVRFETLKSGGADTGGVIKEYEVWATTSSPDTAKLYVYPRGTQDLIIGQTFTVDIRVDDIANFYGWQFNLNFDITHINVSRGPTTPSNTFDQWPQVWFNTTDYVNGIIGISAQVTMGTLPEDTQVGGGSLSTITFVVLSTGKNSTLDLNLEKLVDGWATLIPHTTVDGWFSNFILPEFPLGAAVEIAIPVVLVFFWWTRRRKTIKPKIVSTTLPT